MRRKHELVNGHPVSVWDCPKFIDRYTVVYLDTLDERGNVQYLAMNTAPFHLGDRLAQGFGQHGEMPITAVQYKGRGGAFDKRISFLDLPPDCQRAVIQDLT